jgi:cephalosporin-C deacetylase-like acetyl esterase
MTKRVPIMPTNLRIFNSNQKRTLLGEMVYTLERDLAHRGFEAGEKIKATIKTKKEALARQHYLRRKFLESLGPFPRRTPLNARTVATLQRRHFKVEKIIFQSRPNFLVTGLLYVPKGRRFPRPGILFPCGHKDEGKAGDTYQMACIGLVERRYVVFCYDPLGQGERKQYFDQTGKPFKGPTAEHTFAGLQTLLTGVSLANWRIWDGMRALDYLLSRPEVDKKRIGCTGNSGGGTLTTFISALDERVKVAVPSCYITTWRRMVDTAHNADAEQMPPRLIQFGFEQADLLALIAPRPLKILGAWHDYFPIQGAKETYDDVKRIYAAFGAADRLGIGAGDTPHGFNLPQRQMMYQWFNRWLGKEKEGWLERPARIFAEEKLFCTPKGQVRDLGSETVHSLNKKMSAEILPKPAPIKTKSQIRRLRRRLKQKAAELIDYSPSHSDLPGRKARAGFTARAGKVKAYGKAKRFGTIVEKVSYESEPGIIIPGLLFKNTKRPSSGQILYVHERGKARDARPGGSLERLLKLGYSVLAIDLRGTGETASRIPPQSARARRRYNYHTSEYYLSFLSQMVGRLLFGQRVLDVVQGVEFLKKHRRGGEKIYLYGRHSGGLLALFAALLGPKTAAVIMEEAPVSYKALVDEQMHALEANIVIPGLLKIFDIPHLVAALAPLPFFIINPRDGKGKRMNASAAGAEYALATQAYQVAGRQEALEFICGGGKFILEALKKLKSW